MNLYEHTIVARQDISPAQIKQIQEKYTNIVEKNEGNIIQTTVANNESTTEYIVKKGDSLWLIARRFDIHVAELLEWNNLRKNKPLQPGQTLLIRKNITGA